MSQMRTNNATLGYLATLLQLFATDVFGFATKQNGWLIFMYALLRGLFLTFAFPRLISIGRKVGARKEEEEDSGRTDAAVDSEPSERQPLLTTQSSAAETAGMDGIQDKPRRPEQAFAFDLTYTRFSLLADGLLTLVCSFVRQGWQMYLVAAILPFAAGTGSAAKGSVLQMVGRGASSGERTDALAGVSLVENMARLSTSTLLALFVQIPHSDHSPCPRGPRSFGYWGGAYGGIRRVTRH